MGMNRQEILSRLQQVDTDMALLDPTDEQYMCVIVGGSALVILEKLVRSTHDIDSINASEELVDLLEAYNINMNVRAYLVNFPDSYLNRIVKVDIPTRKVEFYTTSLEDLVVSKLASGREKDQQDIENPRVYQDINWQLMDELVSEVCEGMLTDRDCRVLMQAYREYKERFQ